METHSEEDNAEYSAFLSWFFLIAGLLLASLGRYMSSLIAYLRNRRRQIRP